MNTKLIILIISLFTLMPLKAQNHSTRRITREEVLQQEHENAEREKEIEDKYYEEAKDWLKKHMKKGDPLGNAELYSKISKKLAENGYPIAAERILQTFNPTRMPEKIKKQRGEAGGSDLEKKLQRENDEAMLKEMTIRKKQAEIEQISQHLNSITDLYKEDLTPQERNEIKDMENTFKREKIIRVDNIRKLKKPTTVAATNKPQQQEDPKEELEPEEDLTYLIKRKAELKAQIQQRRLEKQQKQQQ